VLRRIRAANHMMFWGYLSAFRASNCISARRCWLLCSPTKTLDGWNGANLDHKVMSLITRWI
jgi:hypothetical protein